MGMCRWMGSHSTTGLTDYYGFTFLEELLKWGLTFSGFKGSENSGMWGFKNRTIYTTSNLTKKGQFISGCSSSNA